VEQLAVSSSSNFVDWLVFVRLEVSLKNRGEPSIQRGLDQQDRPGDIFSSSSLFEEGIKAALFAQCRVGVRLAICFETVFEQVSVGPFVSRIRGLVRVRLRTAPMPSSQAVRPPGQREGGVPGFRVSSIRESRELFGRV